MAILLPLQLFLHQIQSAAKKIHFRASSCLKMLRPIGRIVCGSERRHFVFIGNLVSMRSLREFSDSARAYALQILGRWISDAGQPGKTRGRHDCPAAQSRLKMENNAG
jgi:hypothetical protein